ncbi:MAG: mannose-1-phosphate guanylyltransferase/phosphomannomutase [Oceanicoccus sp.]|jgi:mannose-1-phosphate guanylyltransferase/phosphomannomutase
MQAIVFADRKGGELAPLCDDLCPAMLPVINRPLLQYTIEDLANAGIVDIIVVLGDHATDVEKTFGKGELYGVNIRYLLSRGEEDPCEVISRSQSTINTPFIAIRGDVLRSPCCQIFLEAAEQHTGHAVAAHIGGTAVGLNLIRVWPHSMPEIDWPHSSNKSPSCAEIHNGLYAPVDNLNNYHQATLLPMDIISPAEGLEVTPGLHVDRQSRVEAQCHQSGHVVVGSNASVHNSARLEGPCIIGNDCYIDRGVTISNSIVLPGTYVGENLHIENAIVSGSTLIRIDRGIQIQVPDTMLLSNMQNELGSLVKQLPDSITAAALLILSCPLWPIALLSTLVCGFKPFVSRPIISNRTDSNNNFKRRRVVKAWQLSTPFPLLRNLPMLWLVIKGDLRMVGSMPLVSQTKEGKYSHWDRRNEQQSAGLLGPAQLLLPPDAPEEEIRLNEITFVANNNGLTTLSLLFWALPMLLSKRAWVGSPKRIQERENGIEI